MKIDLNGKWKFRRCGDSQWLPATVPGSIMNDLMANGLADDPYFRDNEYTAYDLFRHDYEYMREFEVDAGTIRTDSQRLVCNGLDTLADVYLNDSLVASTDNMHRTYSFDAKGLLKTGNNEIRVTIKSPVNYIERAWRESGPVWGVCAKDGYQFIRKAHYMYGWDWGPAIPDGGIWRNIFIETHDGASIGDVYIRQEHERGCVALSVEASVLEYSDAEYTLSGSVSSPDGSHCSDLSFGEGGKALITIDNPLLWWPAGYGNQPMYTIQIRLESAGSSDTETYRIGLRTIEISREDDEWGQEFAYKVNGVKIFAMGANYIPEDNILARCSSERTRDLLKQAVDANFNSIRVWGGGIYPEDWFFDICDEYGLLVWQDFMFACAQYSLDDRSFVESIKAEIEDNIRRLRHHPSITLWCGNNEMEWLWVDSQTEGRSKAQMDEYLKLFEGIIPPIVEKEDPDRLYWPASPSSGGGFNEPNDENRGDVHYWDVWHGLKPFTEYRKFHFRFCSEFGFQSFPCMKTVESFTLPEDRNIFSYVMESHQKNGGANGKILYYLSENFKNPADFKSMLYVSQLLQAEAIKYGVEHWRRNRGRCMGSIYWQFNDCWPVASWSSVDSFHRCKALHYFAKRFYSPVLLSAEDNGLRADLHLSNESMDSISGIIKWELMRLSGKTMAGGSLEASADPLSSRKVISLDFSDLLSDMGVRRDSVLEYSFNGNGVESGSTLIFVPNKYLEYKKAEIKADHRMNGRVLTILLETDTYAGYVELMPLECDCVFSDNYFGMTPGSVREITADLGKPGIEMSPDEFMAQLQVRSIADTY